jgi:hypothetical protein
VKKPTFILTATACAVGLIVATVLWKHPQHDAPVTKASPAAGALESPVPSAPSEPAEAPARPDPVTLTAAARPDAAEPAARVLPSVRIDFEREPRDASAAAAEAQIRGLYAATPGAQGILRSVRCTQSVCKLEARWSATWSTPYNAAIVKLVEAFSRDLTFESAGPPEGLNVPVDIYVRRYE